MWLVIAMVDTDLEALLLLNVQLTRNKTCFKKSKVKQMSKSPLKLHVSTLNLFL